jgi:hypothetical protein
MSDDVEETTSTDDGVPGTPATDRPTSGRRVSATSRARRIGGRADAEGPRATPVGDAGTATAAAGLPDPPAPPTPTKPSTPAKPASHDDAATPSGPVPAWLTWLPAGVLIAAAIAMAVVIGVVSHGVWWGQRYDTPARTNPLREQVAAAAKTCLARTNSYDYRNLDAFEKAGLACTTGQESTQFRQAVQSIVKPNALKIKATQSAQINTTGIESVSGTQWTLLVYGQLKVTNTSTPSGRVDPFAAEVRMDKDHGRWLIAQEKVVSQPAS